jgi:hypothetical protein
MNSLITAVEELQQEVTTLIETVDFRKSELDAAVFATSQSVTLAETAKQESELARDGAEAARDLAEGFKDEAEDARDISITAAQSVDINILALGSISGTVDINLALGTLITATLTGATTLTFSGLPPSTRETAFTLRFSGIHAITLPAGTKYPAGAVPVPEGALYEIPCTINNAGELIVYGVINDIKTP